MTTLYFLGISTNCQITNIQHQFVMQLTRISTKLILNTDSNSPKLISKLNFDIL